MMISAKRYDSVLKAVAIGGELVEEEHYDRIREFLGRTVMTREVAIYLFMNNETNGVFARYLREAKEAGEDDKVKWEEPI